MNAGTAGRARLWFLDLTAWTAALVVAGYPVAALLSTYLGITDDSISVPFRILTFVLALAALWIGAHRVALRPLDPWLAAFWLVYSLRLIWDAYFQPVDGAQSALLAFVVTVLVPVTSVALVSRTWVERNVALCVITLGVITCLGALWLSTIVPVAEQGSYEQEGRLGFDKVNPITLGHVACTTLFASIALVRCEASRLDRAVALAALGIGLVMLFFAASRGPVVAFMVGIVAFAACHAKWRYALVAVLVLYLTASFVAPDDLHAVLEAMRLTQVGDDASSLERYNQYEEALGAFQQHPILGVSYALPLSGGWAHNIFLEAGMATGVVGLALLTIVSARALLRTATALRGNGTLPALLFLQFFVGGQFSGSLWSWPELWMGIAILCALPLRDAHKMPPHPFAGALHPATQDRNSARPFRTL